MINYEYSNKMDFNQYDLIRMIQILPVCSVYLVICMLLGLYYPGYLSDASPSIFFTILVHIDVILILWSYTLSVFTNPGFVSDSSSNPLSYHSEPPTDLQRFREYCMKCRRPRPSRAHHCSICQKCVQGMDHHCPWIGNCVGIHNRRYFAQFLVYSSIDTMALAGCFGELLVKTQGNSNVYTCAGFFFCTGLGIFLVSLAVFQVWTICCNTNCIEIKAFEEKSKFDLGWKNNVKEVCGEEFWKYFLPVPIDIGRGLQSRYRKTEGLAN